LGFPAKKAPSGPFADKLWRDALRRAVLKRVEKAQRLDRIAEKVAALAEAGDMAAAREIGDRLDGKPAQTTDLTIRDERMVVEAPRPSKDAEEWSGKYGPH
jgi:hypothetical protein